MVNTTNIFMNSYEQPENKLTYSFLCLIEQLNVESVQKILSRMGIHTDAIDSINVELLYGGGEANPDGNIQINPESGDKFVIYFENKTWRRKLDIIQIKGHIKVHLCSSKNNLLIITSDKSDENRLAVLNDKRIRFITWNDLVNYLHQLTEESDDSKDIFLLQQFIDYAERKGEAWRAKMINEKLINSFSQILRLSDDIDQFYTEAWRLIENLKDEIVTKFNNQIKSAGIADRWGRLGAECTLENNLLGQWLFFGIYHHTDDHRIKFKKDFQPEFAIFLDMNPENRAQLQKCEGIIDSIKELEKQHFEFNFPEDKNRNAWRVCYWHEPMIKYVNADIEDLNNIFKERLSILFESNFYKILESA